MGRGFFSGTIWGALLGLVAVALASQLTVRRELSFPEPQAAEIEVPGGSEFDQARPETEPVVPSVEAPPAQVEPVEVAQPDTGITAAPTADTVPANAPDASSDAPETVASPEPTEAPRLEVAAEDPERSPQAPPAAPPAAELPATAPAVPPLDARLPAPPDEVAQPVAPEGAVGADVARSSEDASAPDETVAALAQSPEPGAAPRIEMRSADAPPAPQPADAPTQIAPGADPDTGDQIAAVLPETGADAPPTAVPSEAPATPSTNSTAPDAPSGAPAPDGSALDGSGLPQAGFSGASGVRVNRLPSIGDDAQPPVVAEAPGASGDAAGEDAEVRANRLPTVGNGEDTPPSDASDAPAEEIDPDAPPIVRFATPFENPELAPVISIVLLHSAPVAPGPGTGLDLPVPVSFAVDAGLPDAGGIASAYRRAGREIVLVPTLPPGAAPADVEVALGVNLDTIDEAVALMDRPEAGFQSERDAVAQVVDVLAQTGHGLVTFPRGLNTAQQLAERSGVPSRLVFRMLEAEDGNAVLRTLDQAAFRARQEGVVILVGEAEPETVEAIRSWVAANPAAQVVFGPVSAALTAE